LQKIEGKLFIIVYLIQQNCYEAGMSKLILICGDIPRDMAGEQTMDYARLKIEEYQASAEFLWHYYDNNCDANKADDMLHQGKVHTQILPNGIYLQQYLNKRGFTDIELIQVFSLEKSRLEALLSKPHLAVIISTSFLTNSVHINEIAAYVKTINPKTPIIAGGLRIWKSYLIMQEYEKGGFDEDIREDLIRDTYFIDRTKKSPIDLFIVNNRGEYTLVDLLNRIIKHEEYFDLKSLAYYADGRYIINEIAVEPGTFMDEMIDWSKVQIEKEEPEYPVIGGCGCQMRCAFCDFIKLRELQSRSVESLIAELQTIPLGKQGVRKVFFSNDNLLINMKRTQEICEAIIDSKLNIEWRAFTRVDVINEETAQLMYESGCRECLLGIESGDIGILKNMRKRTSPERILRAVNALNKVGINTLSTFIIGFPGETKETLQNTIDLMNSFETSGPGIHSYMLFLFALFPLSIISSREERKKYNIKGYMYKWTHNTMNSEEAAEQLVRVAKAIKTDISPIYWETPSIPGLTLDEQKEFLTTRNTLMKKQRGIPVEDPEDHLWKTLERIICNAQF
jgi:anaerobic magnesium-protoporphyrin IX monomethyl ester cyclase